MPDEDMLISQMYIANISAVVEAIFKVFQMKEGGNVDIYEHEDKLSVWMYCDDNVQFKSLIINDDSGRIKAALSHRYEFVFEEYMSINIPPFLTPRHRPCSG